MHSNIGYIVTLALNLSLLLPPRTAHSPRVNNYVLVLYVDFRPIDLYGILNNPFTGRMGTG